MRMRVCVRVQEAARARRGGEADSQMPEDMVLSLRLFYSPDTEATCIMIS